MVLTDFGKFGRLLALASLAFLTVEAPAQTTVPAPVWTACGWGGGGYYWSAAFDPVNDGLLYMGGDVAGVYKSVDHGKSWRMVNDGIAGYGVFSLAVDPQKPKTVYAATEMGLCKSDDGAEHWRLLPKTGPSELRITGEKTRSIRSVAVDPTKSDVVYAGSPGGKVFKSADGGQSWKAVYEPGGSDGASHLLHAQFGKASGEWSGGLWLPVTYPLVRSARPSAFPAGRRDGDARGLSHPSVERRRTLSQPQSQLNGVFKGTAVQELRLTTSEFEVDPGYKAEHPGAPALDWKKVVRMDLSFVGPLAEHPFSMAIGNPVFVAAARDGKPQRLSAASLTESTTVQTYGNVKMGPRFGGPVYSVAVSKKQPALVLAATDEGLMVSQSAGASWRLAKAPKRASSAVVAATNPNLIYASFFGDGVWKTTTVVKRGRGPPRGSRRA